MTNYSVIGALLGIGVFGIIYNYESLKIELIKQKGIIEANRITIDFFKDLLKKNPKITLNKAILQFEDKNNNFNTLEEFSKAKGRDINCYINAYSKLFTIAKLTF